MRIKVCIFTDVNNFTSKLSNFFLIFKKVLAYLESPVTKNAPTLSEFFKTWDNEGEVESDDREFTKLPPPKSERSTADIHMFTHPASRGTPYILSL